MSPKRFPFSSSVYMVTSPFLIVEVEPSAAFTWPVCPLGPTVSWCRSLMSVVFAVNFRTGFTLPLYVLTLTTPW